MPKTYRIYRPYRVLPPLLLDTYTGAAAAYSLRKLRTAYTGAAIRVRESGGNTELDIGFVGEDLDTAALLAHCGAGSGYVTTWYDQSGNARNATQGTSTAQPRIVNTGVLETQGSKPTLTFDGTDDYLFRTAAFMYNLGSAYAIFAASATTGTASKFWLSEGRGVADSPVYMPLQIGPNSTTNLSALYRTDASVPVINHPLNGAIANNTLSLFAFLDSGSNYKARINATQTANFNYTRATTTLDRFAIGALVRTSVLGYSPIRVCELIIWPSDPTIASVETAVNTYYGIY